MQASKVNGPPKPWSSACMMEVTLDKTQAHKEMGQIRAVHPYAIYMAPYQT